MIDEGVRSTTLLLTGMGIAMTIVGAVLYANAHHLGEHAHLLIPLPPISVAAYIYAVNRFSPLLSGTVSTATLTQTLKHFITEFFVGGLAFLVISFILLGLVLLWNVATR